MTRVENWPLLLDQYIQRHERDCFDWHAQNCALFAARWVYIATGKTIVVPLTHTAKEAVRTLRDFGGLLKATNHYLGEPVPGAYARVGDIALVSIPRLRERKAHALGVCLGTQIAVPGYCGIGLMPLSQSEAAWRV